MANVGYAEMVSDMLPPVSSTRIELPSEEFRRVAKILAAQICTCPDNVQTHPVEEQDALRDTLMGLGLIEDPETVHVDPFTKRRSNRRSGAGVTNS